MDTDDVRTTPAARHGRSRSLPPRHTRSGTRPTLSPPRRRVRVPELAIGFVIVSVCGFGALVWSRSMTATTSVLVAAHDISRGDVLSDDDLVPAELRSAGDLGLVDPADVSTLVGRVALIDVPAGAPLLGPMVDTLDVLADGEALVGVALERGQAPSELAVGDTVRVIVVPDPASLDARGPELVPALALVRAVEPADEYEPRAVVTLTLPVQDAPAVAAAAGVRLVRVER